MSGVSTVGIIQKRTVVTVGEFAGLAAIEDADPQDIVDQLLDAGDVNLLSDAEYAYFLALFNLTPSNDDILQVKSGAWTNRTLAQYKVDLALNLVTNTSDADKPVSTAQATALALKAPLLSPALTGVPTAPTAVPGTNTTQLATTAFVIAQYGGTIIGYNSGDDAVNPTSNAYADAGLLLKQSLTGKDASNGYVGLTLLKIDFKNVADTFTSFLTNTNTAARTYTFQDSDDTIVGRATTDTLTNKTLIAPILGTPTSGVLTNCTGTASGLTAGDVANSAVIAKVLTGYTSGSGTVASTDTILQAIQKLNGNDALKAPLSSPSFTTPTLGVATATSINKVALTQPATGSTLTILDGKTLTVNKSITLEGTDSTTITFPSTNATVARTDAAQAFTGIQTFLSVIGLTSGGIKFPSTQVPSADANTLDDYEEFTFTPGFAFNGGTTGITYAAQKGTGTKIGNVIFYKLYIQLSNKGSSTGSATVTGLPTNSLATANTYSTMSFRCDGIAYTGIIQGYLSTNATIIGLEKLSVLGAVSGLDDTNFSNSSAIMITGWYTI